MPRKKPSTNGKTEPAKEPAANPAPPPDGNGVTWDSWPTLNKLSTENAIPRADFARLITGKGAKFIRCPDGSMRIPADVAAQLVPEVREQWAEDKPPTEAAPMTQMADLVKAMAELLGTAQDQVKSLVRLVVEPLKVANDAKDKILIRALDRVELLENKRDELAREREELLNERAVREMAERKAAAEEERKAAAWAEVIKLMPVLGGQVTTTLSKWLGSDPEALEKMKLAQELLAELPRDQVEVLISDEFPLLSAKQREMLSKLTGVPIPKKPAPAAAPTSESAKSAGKKPAS